MVAALAAVAFVPAAAGAAPGDGSTSGSSPATAPASGAAPASGSSPADGSTPAAGGGIAPAVSAPAVATPTGLRVVDGPPLRVPSPLEVAKPGAEGEAVANLQRRLTELGYWLGPVDGKYSALTVQAVMAFQKYSDLERTGRADLATIDALAAAVRPVARTTEGSIAEVDKRRQVVLLVRDGRVEWVFNTSTGSGKRYTETGTSGKEVSGTAVTPDGRFTINREIAQGWRESELGLLWRPKYFNGGIAFHGAPNVPAYPASHGCVRLTVKAMDFMWEQNYLPQGLPVWVYSD